MPPTVDISSSPWSRPRRVYASILAGLTIWCGAILLAPVLASSGAPWSGVAEGIYHFFHRICHQLEPRCVHIAGHPMAVCARCAAIYGAFFLGTLLYPLIRSLNAVDLPPRLLLLAGIVPMTVDVACGVLGLHPASLMSRLVTGSLAGFVLPWYILPAGIGAVRQLAGALPHPIFLSYPKGPSDA